jgi:hypothetical protein
MLVVLAAGLMLLQVGLAADYKGRAQTAADAAALAGAIEVKREIEAAWATDGQLLPEQIQMGLVCAQAAEYAARNRARVESCRREQYDILVEVRGSDELDQVGDTEELDGDAASAKARATPWGFGGGGFGAGGGTLPVGGGGGGSLMGADPRLAVYADAAAKFGLSVSSGLRPGDSDSFHGSGNALDLAAPMTPAGEAAMLRFARYAEEHWGSQLEELIHTPLGYGIKNGQRVPLSFWGPPRTPSTSTTCTSPTPIRPSRARTPGRPRPASAVPAPARARSRSAAASASWGAPSV